MASGGGNVRYAFPPAPSFFPLKKKTTSEVAKETRDGVRKVVQTKNGKRNVNSFVEKNKGKSREVKEQHGSDKSATVERCYD